MIVHLESIDKRRQISCCACTSCAFVCVCVMTMFNRNRICDDGWNKLIGLLYVFVLLQLFRRPASRLLTTVGCPAFGWPFLRRVLRHFCLHQQRPKQNSLRVNLRGTRALNAIDANTMRTEHGRRSGFLAQQRFSFVAKRVGGQSNALECVSF